MMIDDVGCHHYCRIIPVRWQVRISLERGTVPELNDPCDMYHHFVPWFHAYVLSLS